MLSDDEVKHLSGCFLLQDDNLLRKWVPQAEDVGDPIFWVVTPLKLAHDGSGHLEVQKTHDWNLHHSSGHE